MTNRDRRRALLLGGKSGSALTGERECGLSLSADCCFVCPQRSPRALWASPERQGGYSPLDRIATAVVPTTACPGSRALLIRAHEGSGGPVSRARVRTPCLSPSRSLMGDHAR
jgi:hypothetical protein